MKRLDLQVTKRDKTGKGAARSSRRDGRIPAVVYGGDKDPISISVDAVTMRKTMHSGGGESENVLVNLMMEGDSEATLALVRDTQHNPLTGKIEHLDFYRVSLDRPISTTIPIHTTGTAVGTKTGGMFEQVLREVEIECLPLNIPDFVEVDITNLALGQSLHVSDLPQSDTYRILTSPERSIATVTAPKVEAAPRAAQEGEAAGAGAAPAATA